MQASLVFLAGHGQDRRETGSQDGSKPKSPTKFAAAVQGGVEWQPKVDGSAGNAPPTPCLQQLIKQMTRKKPRDLDLELDGGCMGEAVSQTSSPTKRRYHRPRREGVVRLDTRCGLGSTAGSAASGRAPPGAVSSVTSSMRRSLEVAPSRASAVSLLLSPRASCECASAAAPGVPVVAHFSPADPAVLSR